MMLILFPLLAVFLILLGVVIIRVCKIDETLKCLLQANKLEVLPVPYFPTRIYLYFQIFLSCYIGNLYSSEYEKLQAELYESPWYNYSNKYKTIVKILLQNFSAPITFTVGKFSNLNLMLFLSVTKTRISYCMVLQLMQRN